MILQGNYTDNTKKLIQSFDEEMNKKNAELEAAQAELGNTQAELADADNALKALRLEIKSLGTANAADREEQA